MKNIKTFYLSSVVVTIRLLTFSLESIAQTESVNKIIVSFGGGAVPGIIDATNDLAEALFSNGTRTSDTGFSGAFGIHYDRAINEKFSAGISFLFEGVQKDVTITGSTNTTH